MPRHSFSGAAVTTTITSQISSGAMTIPVVATTGFPNTATGPFVCTLDRGKSTEEKVLISSYTGSTLTVQTRGYDGTAAVTHSNGATCEHTIDATQIDAHDSVVFGVGTVAPVASAVGDTVNNGVSTMPAAADHRHAREAFGSSASASAVGDTQAAGVATTPARSDHVHGREAFSATTPAAGTLAGTAGVATTPARSDHAHPTPVYVAPGIVSDYAGSAAPAGWLLCDGSAVSRTTYAALYAAIGTVWGPGDGSTTFNVPDARGRTAVGVGTGSGLTARALAATGGEENHALTLAELAAHDHGTNTGGTSQNHTHAAPGGGTGFVVGVASTVGLTPTGSNQAAIGPAASSGQSVDHTHVISSAGSGTPHNTMQPWAAFNKIIKT